MTSAPRLHDQLCFQLYAASRLVIRAYQPLLADLGLTYPQYLAMLVLWEHDDAGTATTVGELGDRLLLDSGTLTPLLKRLEAQGLVTRRRSDADERVVHVQVTPAGRALADRAADVPNALTCRVRADEAAGLRALREQVRGLVTALSAAG